MHDWILDTGATDHVTPHLNLLHNVVECESVLHLPNGQTARVTHMGSVTINSHITLHQVLCVPLFQYNLMLISKLLLHYPTSSVQFQSHVCYLQAPTLMRDLEIGRLVNGLYILQSTSSTPPAVSCSAAHSSSA